MVASSYFVKATPLRAIAGSFQHFADMLDILEMCMKKFGAEKLFFDKLRGFYTPHKTVLVGVGYCFQHV